MSNHEVKISITEAIVAQMVEHDGVDSTNAVQSLRAAQGAFVEYSGLTTAADVSAFLDEPRTLDDIDSIVILVTENGHRDIFFD